MFIDIVFPKNNEKEFIKIAEKLNIKSLCFIYKNQIPKPHEVVPKTQSLQALNIKTKIKLFQGILIRKPSEKQRKIADLILIEAEENAQKLFENKNFDIIFNLEAKHKKDPFQFRASGLNQILANLAAKNNIIIAFPFSILLNSEYDIARTKLLGKIQQNIRICKKYKVKTAIASFASNPYELRSESDLKSLALTLGMTPKQTKESFSAIYNKIQENIKKKSKNYIGEGIELIE
jgi:RNase P/RNase MRP subunit p30